MKAETIIIKLSEELSTLLKLPKTHTPYVIDYMQKAYAAGFDDKRSHTSHRKKVKQYTLSGELLAIHDSMAAAARSVKGERANIGHACARRYNRRIAYGFLWKYADYREHPSQKISEPSQQKK